MNFCKPEHFELIYENPLWCGGVPYKVRWCSECGPIHIVRTDGDYDVYVEPDTHEALQVLGAFYELARSKKLEQA